MDEKRRRDQKWGELEEYIRDELKKARQRTRLADSLDEMEEMVVEVGPGCISVLRIRAIITRSLTPD